MSTESHSGADGDPPLNGYEPNAQTEGPDTSGVDENTDSSGMPGSSDSEEQILEFMWNSVLTTADVGRLESVSLQWVDKAISGLRQECSGSCTMIQQLRDKVIVSQDEAALLHEHVSVLEDKLAESESQLRENIELLGSSNKRNVQLGRDMKELVGRLEESKVTADEKLAKLKMELSKVMEGREEQIDQASCERGISTRSLRILEESHARGIDELQDQISVLRHERVHTIQSGAGFSDLVGSGAVGSDQDQFGRLVSTLNNFVTKVDVSIDSSGSRGRSRATVKPADVKEFKAMPSLDAQTVSVMGRLVRVSQWFEGQRRKVRAMFPENAVGDAFWSWVWESASEAHLVFLRLSPKEQVCFEANFGVPSRFADISERLLDLVYGSVDTTVEFRCVEWSRRSSAVAESVTGVMFLTLIQAFEGLDDERKQLRSVIDVPPRPTRKEGVSAVLLNWLYQFEVCSKFVSVSPDWGLMIAELNDFAADLDGVAVGFGFQRNKFVDDEGLLVYADATKERFLGYMSFLRALIVKMGPKQIPQGQVSARTVGVASAQRETKDKSKPCPLFQKGVCEKGSRCRLWHDCDIRKYGPMCFVCGARDSIAGQKFHTAQVCPVRATERAAKGKGKGAPATAQLVRTEGVVEATKHEGEAASQLFR